ncbi:acetyl-CoA carboxylase, carboxyl transferase, beta subunit [Eubacterium sp. 14-2]|uniref:acetyl-coenzyme A carboxylase carboxyl transferase subunits beta/alpha n=1 Tax=Eubacterium sp. 14-2 TaxID=1235790 RepID=UPI00033F16CB|nr:carboxyltransferase subunit alpha [Eubacterium sp. 14-2]EOT24374.1 acetyl-CoA carboxylase, carboxyl transferase, beta subunit [Eubacterium sp. 14-2]
MQKTDYRICRACNAKTDRKLLKENYFICPECGGYLRFHADERIQSLADEESFREWDQNLELDVSGIEDAYAQKLAETSEKYNLKEAVITGEIKINGISAAIGVMDSRFLMASMGYVVGEKVTRLFERATEKKLPVILFSCSGGARMQEGIISLMQMSKTAAAVQKHSEEGLLYISVLTNPTMGGVTASFAMLADIIFAEKSAVVGFAGRRVIEQNVGDRLPDEFQTAEFQVAHGFVDEVMLREETRDRLGLLLELHRKNGTARYRKWNIKPLTVRKNRTCLTPWEKVKYARSADRPMSRDYIDRLFQVFVELKGDRISGDDHAVVAGIAEFHGQAVTVIGQERGKKSLKDAVYRNWGMMLPCGYRKVLRLMKQAEKFHRPVICFIDTIGAACGREAEEAGQGTMIANLLEEAAAIKVPILSVLIGEGYSGGALALAVANEVWMMENAVYSILSPEGYASILWKDNRRAKEAAREMKMEADDLCRLQIVDKVIEEKEAVNSRNIDCVCRVLNREILQFMERYSNKSEKDIVDERYRRYRKY